MKSAENMLEQARNVVENYLDASMAPDPVRAFTYMSADVDITFTGATKFKHPSEATEYNAKRYKWVKKRLGHMDACLHDGVIVVYSFGTLFGEWPDGELFEDNRYIDRFELRDGKIVKMDVLNDSAERILKKQKN